MNRRKRWVRTGAWAGFVLLFLVICFLSFQTGSATKALEKPFVNQVAGVLEEQPSEEWLLTAAFYIRQTGRAVLFFALGFCGTAAMGLTFEHADRRLLGGLLVLLLFGMAYFTEKMKIFIEGRHYAFAECLEGFAFAVLGGVCLCVVLRLAGRRKAANEQNDAGL